MWLLDRIEEKDKEYYDKIFNEYKTAFLKKFKNNWDDEGLVVRLVVQNADNKKSGVEE